MAKTRRAPTFTAQSVGLWWPTYLCWIFYFFVGKYYTQKVLVVFVFLIFVFLNPFGKRNHSYQNPKDSFLLGQARRRK